MTDIMYHMDQQNAFFPVTERPVFAGEWSTEQLDLIREAPVRDDPMFNAQIRDMQPVQFHAVPNRKALTNDKGKTMAIVSQNYKVITTEQIFEAFDKSLSNSDINCEGMTTKVRMANDGARTLVHLTFPEHTIELKDRSRSAILEIIIRNSYDRHWAFDVRGGLLDCACFNEAFTGNWAAAYRAQHNSMLDIDIAAEKVTTILDDFKDTPELWERMRTAHVADAAAWQVIADYNNKDREMQLDYYKFGHANANTKNLSTRSVSRDMMKQYLNSEVPVLGRNAFALYNCLTYDATHRNYRKGQEANNKSNRMHRVARTMESSFWQTDICPLA